MLKQSFSITNLTRDGIILLEENIKEEIFVQIKKIEEIKRDKDNSTPKNKYYKVELNDGFTYCSYIFIARAAEKLENLALFSIIKPSNDVKSLPNYKNKMILDFDIINDRVRELIGMPIDIQKYNNNNRVNLEGNTSIPFKYLQYEPQTIKEEVKEKEEENNIESKNILNISYKRERDFEPFKFQSNSQKTNLSENKSERIFEPIIQERKYQTPPRKIDYKEKDYFDENIPIFKQEENLIQENIQTSKKNFFEKFKFSHPHSEKPKIHLNQNNNNIKEHFYPINALKPETLHWRIKARVLKKNDLKAFKNTTRNQMSCLLKIILIDKNRDEIQAIFYGEDAEHWNENLQEGKVYGFRGGLLKKTKPAFNATKHDYEIVFDKRSEIIPLYEDNESMMPKFQFKSVKEIIKMNVGETVDVKGIIYETDIVNEILLKSGDKTKKKQILLYDDSEEFIEIGLWGKAADIEIHKNDIFTFKNLRVCEYNSKKQLNTTYDSLILSNQESIPELREFVSWAKSEKKSNFESSTHKGFGNRINNNLSSDDKIYTLAEIISESEKLLESKEKRSFSCFFNILRFETESSNFYYDSCINEKCSKKVTLDSSGLYKCEQCQKLFEEPRVRYRLKAYISDHTAQLKITMFEEVGSEILGVSSVEMKILKDAEMLDDISLFFMKTRFLEMKGKVSAKYDNYLGDKIDYSLIFVFANLQKNSKEFIKHKSLEIDRYLFEMGESQNII